MRRRRRRNLDALARRGLRFTQATTVVPLTLPAHSSLLTGTFPAWHGVRDNGGFYLGDDQLTLAEVLKDKGFRTGGFVSAFVLDRRWGIAQGFERFFDDFDLEKFSKAPSMDFIQRPGSETVEQAMAWLGEDRARPFFAWVHLYDPHAPYEAPEPYRSRFPATLQGAYDAEIASADADVGRLLDGLARQGRLEDTLVVVLADHGEMLGEHGEQTARLLHLRRRGAHPAADGGPRSRAARDLRPGAHRRRHADGARAARRRAARRGPGDEPAAAHPRAAAWPGRALGDLVSALSLRLERAALGAGRALQAHRGPASRAVRSRLGPWRAQRPGGRRRGAGAVDARPRSPAFESRTTSAGAAKGPAPVDAETEEKLAALGYVGSVSGSHLKDVAGVVRGDPKDKIGLYNLLKKAGSASGGDNQDEAIALVRSALRQDPTIVEGYMLLGNFLSKAKRLDDAVAAYKQALALDPEHQNALFSLAVAYKDGNRLEDARLGFERARALDPRNGKVLFQLADLALRQKRPAGRRSHHSRRARAQGGRAPLPAEARRELHRVEALRGSGEGTEGGAREKGRPARGAVRPRPRLRRHRPPRDGDRRLSRGTGAQRPPRTARPSIWPSFWRARANWPRPPPSFARPSRSIPTSAPGACTSPRRCSTRTTCQAPKHEAKKGLAQNPDPQMAPLGHYVLADVYSRLGREQDARREAALAKRLERPVD